MGSAFRGGPLRPFFGTRKSEALVLELGAAGLRPTSCTIEPEKGGPPRFGKSQSANMDHHGRRRLRELRPSICWVWLLMALIRAATGRQTKRRLRWPSFVTYI